MASSSLLLRFWSWRFCSKRTNAVFNCKLLYIWETGINEIYSCETMRPEWCGLLCYCQLKDDSIPDQQIKLWHSSIITQHWPESKTNCHHQLPLLQEEELHLVNEFCKALTPVQSCITAYCRKHCTFLCSFSSGSHPGRIIIALNWYGKSLEIRTNSLPLASIFEINDHSALPQWQSSD